MSTPFNTLRSNPRHNQTATATLGPDFPREVRNIWENVNNNINKSTSNNTKLVFHRTNWKTIRIFVSSTFKDFHSERECLVKHVFPQLRAWCEDRRLHLLECDLRWGIPKDTTTEETMRMCLEEIDRCYQENINPFFVNMTSERCGWIPSEDEVPLSVKEEYSWIGGLSLTEMEIFHSSLRIDNPNACFMVRDQQFLDTVPREHRKVFLDHHDLASDKLKMLKYQLYKRFPKERCYTYSCRYDYFDEDSNTVVLCGFERFSEKILNFFKKRIEIQYPLDPSDLDQYAQKKEMHEAFMKSRSDSLIGRDEVLKSIVDYVEDPSRDVPLIILGEPGLGKTSIMAKATDKISAAISGGHLKLPSSSDQEWKIFYHFVGATPSSTDLESLLKRFLRETNIFPSKSLPKDFESVCHMVNGILMNESSSPIILLIDAVNQLDEEKDQNLFTWLPKRLAPKIRVIMSMIDGSLPHLQLQKRERTCLEEFVKPLDSIDRATIVRQWLSRYSKILDPEQMSLLLNKSASHNPLWLTIACEELRVFGQFSKVADKINQLADGLFPLLEQVLTRFEKEHGGHLMVATLSFLEVSCHGLLERELLQLLGDDENLIPKDWDDVSEYGEMQKVDEKGCAEKREKSLKDIGPLPAAKWSPVYHALRRFLRPYGQPGEGRLDFYHRSLSKVVRKKYFAANADDQKHLTKKIRNWWHRKLADYFEDYNIIERKVEEFPIHCLAINDHKRLLCFLKDWSVLDIVYDNDMIIHGLYCTTLMKIFRQMHGDDGYKKMQEVYSEMAEDIQRDENMNYSEKSRYLEKLANLICQAGEFKRPQELLDIALNIERDQLNSPEDRLSDLNYTLCFVLDQLSKEEVFTQNRSTPLLRQIVNHAEQSCTYRRQIIERNDDPLHKFKLGRILILKAFHQGGLMSRYVNDAYELKKSALLAVNEAIEIFQKLDDKGLLAEAYMTKAVVYSHDYNPNRWKLLMLYNMALELSIATYGEFSILSSRTIYNMGIEYELLNRYEDAYQLFRRSWIIDIELYGNNHTKTRKTESVMTERMYSNIGKRFNDYLPNNSNPNRLEHHEHDWSKRLEFLKEIDEKVRVYHSDGHNDYHTRREVDIANMNYEDMQASDDDINDAPLSSSEDDFSDYPHSDEDSFIGDSH